jgi:hypothetical protein
MTLMNYCDVVWFTHFHYRFGLLHFVKDHVKSVLPISSAHNKWGPTYMNIAQILHLSNFFELKRTLVYIYLQLRTRKVLDVQLVCLILQI